MRIPLALSLLACAACQTTAEAPSSPPPRPSETATAAAAPAPRRDPGPPPAPVMPRVPRADPGPVLPPAKEGFVLQPDERGGPRLDHLLEELARVTGVHFVIDDGTEQVLKQSETGLRQELVVPAASAWTIGETLLAQNGVVLVPALRDEPFVVLVLSMQAPRPGNPVRAQAVAVQVEDLPRYAEHAAILVTTVIDVAPVDGRMLSTSMRQLFPDQETMAIVPLTGSQILLTGFAPDIAALVALLQRAAATERQRAAEAPPAAESAQK